MVPWLLVALVLVGFLAVQFHEARQRLGSTRRAYLIPVEQVGFRDRHDRSRYQFTG